MWSFMMSFLAAVREGGVRVRSTVDRTVRIGHGLAASSRHNYQHGGDNGQHEDEASNCDGDGKVPLGHTNRILRGLQKTIKFIKISISTINSNPFSPSPSAHHQLPRSPPHSRSHTVQNRLRSLLDGHRRPHLHHPPSSPLIVA